MNNHDLPKIAIAHGIKHHAINVLGHYSHLTYYLPLISIRLDSINCKNYLRELVCAS